MLFKLSIRNMKKSFKDYAIYFLTLVLGVAIFYMFNSLDSQQAMFQVSQSTRQMIRLMIELLGMISIFIAIILGFLIVYANNFLINRRKREFGIYMTLGMGRRQISSIILLETILVGILSLIVGIFVGVFASQFMSILVAKLFEADMTEFTFVFSKDACIKTCIYFAVMYVAVIVFNTLTVSRYKLINLLTAVRKNEKVKIKNPVISIIVFLLSCRNIRICILLSNRRSIWITNRWWANKTNSNGNSRNSRSILVIIWIYIKNYTNKKKHLLKRNKYVCIETIK